MYDQTTSIVLVDQKKKIRKNRSFYNYNTNNSKSYFFFFSFFFFMVQQKRLWVRKLDESNSHVYVIQICNIYIFKTIWYPVSFQLVFWEISFSWDFQKIKKKFFISIRIVQSMDTYNMCANMCLYVRKIFISFS